MLKKIILSRGRYNTITTHKLLNDFILICPMSERDSYKKKIPNATIETIPDDIVGLAKVRNYCIKKYKDDILFLDDDIIGFYSMCSFTPKKIKDKDAVDQLLNNVYICAKDLKVKIFGINQSADPRKYLPNMPFKLKGWVGSVIGIIGKDLLLDETNKMRVDVDLCLQTLMKDRLLWVENRFAFKGKKNTNIGGNALVRSEDSLREEKKYLKNKWGKYIQFGKGKDIDLVKIIVDREERIL